MRSDLLKVRPRTWGLFGKYVVSFVGLVVFVLAVNGALEMYITYRDTTTTLAAQQTQRAEALAQRIDNSISEIERQISWATRASSNTLEQHRTDYGLLLQQVPAIEELAHLDGNGRERIRARRRTRGPITAAIPASPKPSRAESGSARPISAAIPNRSC